MILFPGRERILQGDDGARPVRADQVPAASLLGPMRTPIAHARSPRSVTSWYPRILLDLLEVWQGFLFKACPIPSMCDEPTISHPCDPCAVTDLIELWWCYQLERCLILSKLDRVVCRSGSSSCNENVKRTYTGIYWLIVNFSSICYFISVYS